MGRPGNSKAAAGSVLRKAARAAGLRSGFELEFRQDLEAREVPFEFEAIRLAYTVSHTYVLDWRIRTRTGKTLMIETKGYLDREGRTKLLQVREQNPVVELRLVFQRKPSPEVLRWLTRTKFKWAVGVLPEAWLHE